MIAALYVQTGGVYYGLDDVDPWDEARDARLYAGPWPVVAHPPCARWSTLAYIHAARTPVGEDGGCFAAALAAVREYGGVLEHPARSLAWSRYGLPTPSRHGWTASFTDDGVTTEIDQAAYGHKGRKRTWLYASGCDLPALDWRECSGTHHVEDLATCVSSRTPELFRDVLLDMARSVVKRDARVHTASCQEKSPGAV